MTQKELIEIQVALFTSNIDLGNPDALLQSISKIMSRDNKTVGDIDLSDSPILNYRNNQIEIGKQLKVNTTDMSISVLISKNKIDIIRRQSLSEDEVTYDDLEGLMNDILESSPIKLVRFNRLGITKTYAVPAPDKNYLSRVLKAPWNTSDENFTLQFLRQYKKEKKTAFITLGTGKNNLTEQKAFLFKFDLSNSPDQLFDVDTLEIKKKAHEIVFSKLSDEYLDSLLGE